MPTLWEVPDDLWRRMEKLIEQYDPPKATGRPREEASRILDGLIFHFRTGCRWNHIPRVYGDDSTIHRTFQKWVEWQWQAADTALGKARSGGDQIGPNPTDRAKNGSKRSLLTDGWGGPLAVAGANVHDC